MSYAEALVVHEAATAEGQKAGPIGLAVILLLIVACTFLFKSMSKHLRRVREEFPVPSRSAASAARSASETDRTVPDAAPDIAAPEVVVLDAVAPDAVVPDVVVTDRAPGPESAAPPGATAPQ